VNKNLKRGLVFAASAAAIASLALAAPAQAHDRGSANGTTKSQTSHSRATVSATITGIPTSVTSSHVAQHGAYFTVYKLADTQTSLPATEPTSGGKQIRLHPATPGSTSTITNGTLTGILSFHGTAGTTVRYAVYPSNGGSAELVTVVTDANGVSTISKSGNLTASYSQSVADVASVKGEGMKMGHKAGHKGDHRGGHKDGRKDGRNGSRH
jgi:hypothetical protein